MCTVRAPAGRTCATLVPDRVWRLSLSATRSRVVIVARATWAGVKAGMHMSMSNSPRPRYCTRYSVVGTVHHGLFSQYSKGCDSLRNRLYDYTLEIRLWGACDF